MNNDEKEGGKERQTEKREKEKECTNGHAEAECNEKQPEGEKIDQNESILEEAEKWQKN